jgi:rSAM/selenodomain-associated transferase 2
MASTVWLSIVIPTLNEATTILPLLQTLQQARQQGVEVIMVDGGSCDETVSIAAPWVDQCLLSETGRAAQQNAGAQVAKAPLLWFVHADTTLEGDEWLALKPFTGMEPLWGRFDVRLAGRGWQFRMIAGLMNIRSRLTAVATGDQGIFVSHGLFQQVGRFPSQPLMEDVEICKRLRRVRRPLCLQQCIIADSRRWRSNGVWRTVWLMWCLRWRYFRGADPVLLHQEYYGSPELTKSTQRVCRHD